MLKKCTALWREAQFEVKMHKTPHVRATFGGSDVEKVYAVVARSTCRSENAQNASGPLLHVQALFRVAGTMNSAPLQNLAKRVGFVAVSSRICKDAFSVAGAVQETSSSKKLGDQGADFLRGCILERLQVC